MTIPAFHSGGGVNRLPSAILPGLRGRARFRPAKLLIRLHAVAAAYAANISSFRVKGEL